MAFGEPCAGKPLARFDEGATGFTPALYSTMENKVPMAADAIFRIASMSKADHHRRRAAALRGGPVNNDPGYYGELGSEGSYGWGSTYFLRYLVDPKEKLWPFL